MVLASGLVPVIAGAVAASFQTQMYAFLFAYLVCTGYGASTVLVNSLWVGWAAWPQRKGLASGICMLGFGLGAAVIGLGFTLCINPNNEAPTVEVADGNAHVKLFTPHIANRVPWTLRAAAIAYGVCGIVGLLLVKEQANAQQRASIVQSFTSSNRANPTNCPSIKRAIRTSAFWNLCLYAYCTNAFRMYLLIVYKNYGLTANHSDQVLSLIGAVALVCNTVARFVLPALLDCLPFKSVSMVVMVLEAGLAVTMPLAVSVDWVYGLWVCLAFICFASTLAPLALVCGQVFGPM